MVRTSRRRLHKEISAINLVLAMKTPSHVLKEDAVMVGQGGAHGTHSLLLLWLWTVSAPESVKPSLCGLFWTC